MIWLKYLAITVFVQSTIFLVYLLWILYHEERLNE